MEVFGFWLQREMTGKWCETATYEVPPLEGLGLGFKKFTGVRRQVELYRGA